MTNNDYDYSFKLVIIGDSNVGKTNIISKFTKNKFFEFSKNTIGVDYFNKNIEMDGKNILIQIWDTAGQEKYILFN